MAYTRQNHFQILDLDRTDTRITDEEVRRKRDEKLRAIEAEFADELKNKEAQWAELEEGLDEQKEEIAAAHKRLSDALADEKQRKELEEVLKAQRALHQSLQTQRIEDMKSSSGAIPATNSQRHAEFKKLFNAVGLGDKFAEGKLPTQAQIDSARDKTMQKAEAKAVTAGEKFKEAVDRKDQQMGKVEAAYQALNDDVLRTKYRNKLDAEDEEKKKAAPYFETVRLQQQEAERKEPEQPRPKPKVGKAKKPKPGRKAPPAISNPDARETFGQLMDFGEILERQPKRVVIVVIYLGNNTPRYVDRDRGPVLPIAATPPTPTSNPAVNLEQLARALNAAISEIKKHSERDRTQPSPEPNLRANLRQDHVELVTNALQMAATILARAAQDSDWRFRGGDPSLMREQEMQKESGREAGRKRTPLSTVYRPPGSEK